MKLSDEHIKKAVTAMYKCCTVVAGSNHHAVVAPESSSIWGNMVRAAAPFIQIPWEDPSAEESARFRGDIWDLRCGHFDRWDAPLLHFIQRRNAALQPKPVDPRREKIVDTVCRTPKIDMGSSGMMFSRKESELIADSILAALNAKD